MIFRTTNLNAPAADTVKLLRAEMHTIHSSAAPVHLSGCCSVCSATAPLWMRLCPRAAVRHLPRRQRKVRKSSVLGFLLERSEIWVAGGGNNGSTIFIGVVLGLFGWDWANFLCACSLGLWKQEHIRNMLGRKHKNSPFIKERERERETWVHLLPIPNPLGQLWRQYFICFTLWYLLLQFGKPEREQLDCKICDYCFICSECLLAHDTITVYHSLIWKLNLYFAPWKCPFFFVKC